MLSAEEWQIVRLSLGVAATAVLAIALPGGWMAYRLARGQMPGAFLVENLIQLPLVLPPVVTGYLLLIAFSPNGLLGGWLEAAFGWRIPFTWAGAWIAAGTVAFPLFVQTARVAFEQVRPEWVEAARVDGSGGWDAFRYVTLPLAGRGLAAGAILAFARALGEFGATIVLAGNIPGTSRTLPTAIFTRLHQIGGDAGAWRLVLVAVILSVVSILVHALLTRRLHHPGTDER
jgi:molybdate transport system permease protein